MTFLKLISPQGWVGIILSATLGILLVLQQGETRHWHKQSDQFEKLYRAEVTAHATTIANYRVAAEQAEAADKANAQRVLAEQATINKQKAADYEARIAAARAHADSLRQQLAQAGTHQSGSHSAPVPGVPTATGGAPQGADPHGLSLDERLTATEQAIQLDELVKWVRQQHAVDVNGKQ